MTRILLVDDEPNMVALLKRGLAYEGFEVYTAANGEASLAAAEQHQPHVVLLDIVLPGRDGFDVCRCLRLRGDMAIIMLTARDAMEDKVNALNIGADDYVSKPFAFDELVARIRAVLRRYRAGCATLAYADLELNHATHEVHRAGTPIKLTTREYALLSVFMRHPRQVLTREQLLEHAWGDTIGAETNVLEVHIGHLRRKLEAHGAPRLIQTIRGIGYALKR